MIDKCPECFIEKGRYGSAHHTTWCSRYTGKSSKPEGYCIYHDSYECQPSDLTDVRCIKYTKAALLPPDDRDVRFMLTAQEIRMLVNGNPIPAIKSLREREKCSLLCAKRSVDVYRVALDLLVEEPCTNCGGTGNVLRAPRGK